jgi:group II intron reverse transcriptase/maturase
MATRHQKSSQLELAFESTGEARMVEGSDEVAMAEEATRGSGSDHLIEQMVERGNLLEALHRVRRNKGSAGVDGMKVEELMWYLRKHWGRLREELLSGEYVPSPVRRQLIPKGDGGMRQLGIPTVLDRFVQQALLQVLQPKIDPSFSDHSYGYRPGRSAHDAVRRAQSYIESGRRWVVEIDLEQFFDRVNHDVLVDRLAKRIADKRVLRLVRKYLEAGMMVEGVREARQEGTPQGGPLSPLLANVLLDEVDQELVRRGASFVRYADDCNVYVGSKRAAERVGRTMKKLYGKLRLKVNQTKSGAKRWSEHTLLGYGFWASRGGVIRLRVGPKAMARMKSRVRELTGRNRGRSMERIIGELRSYLVGWKGYYQLSETPGKYRELDQWIARRLRMVQLKQWKWGWTAYEAMRRMGVGRHAGAAVLQRVRRWWWMSKHVALQTAMPRSHFDQLGVPRLAPH